MTVPSPADTFGPQRLAGTNGPFDRLVAAFSRVAKKRFQGHADGLFGGESKHQLRAPIPGRNGAVRRDAEYCLARRGYDGCKFGIGNLSLFALGNIDCDSQHRNGATLRIAANEGTPIKPPYFASGTDNAELLLEGICLAGYSVEICLTESLAVMRVYEAQDLFRIAGEFVR